jgi:hypothetical protein
MQTTSPKPPQTPTPLVVHRLATSALVAVLGDALAELKQPGSAFDRSDIIERIETVLASTGAVAQ